MTPKIHPVIIDYVEGITTYTRSQAMTALGIKSRSAFHYLRKHYPQAFVIVHQGAGGDGTLYDKAALDKFIKWRKMLKVYKQYRAALPDSRRKPWWKEKEQSS